MWLCVKMDKIDIFILNLLLFSISLNVYLANEIDPITNYLPKETNSALIEEITKTNSDCNNLTLEDSVSCVVDSINHIYRVNDDDNILSDKELFELGGDCLDWTRFYERVFNELGFNTTNKLISVDDSVNHIFAVITDSTGYCTIDIYSYTCVTYGEN